MDTDRVKNFDDLRLGELIRILWNSRLLMAVVAAIFVVMGCVAYFLVPPTFVSKVSIYPLQQTQFANYAGLTAEKGAFPYTPATLFSEFSSHLMDVDRLSAIAEKSGVIERQLDNDAIYNLRMARFISGIQFTTPKPPEAQAGQLFLHIEAKARNQVALQMFMRQLLLSASADMAGALSKEVRERASDLKSQLGAQIAKLKVDIEARRRTAENVRMDDVTRLSEQATIARSLGIEKPLGLRVVEAAEQGKTTSAQINNSGDNDQPDYLQGYAALEERIAVLQNRKSGDPFIEDLRNLEQQLYIAQNDPRPSHIVSLLELSPLRDPGTATLAHFSVSSITAEKVFPRLSTFIISSLSFGLMLGALIAFFRR